MKKYKTKIDTWSSQVIDRKSLNEVVETEESSRSQTLHHFDDIFWTSIALKDLQNVVSRQRRFWNNFGDDVVAQNGFLSYKL